MVVVVVVVVVVFVVFVVVVVVVAVVPSGCYVPYHTTWLFLVCFVDGSLLINRPIMKC